MKECRDDSSCETETCCGEENCCCRSCCSKEEKILHLAKCAKHELLKEKMKKHFEAKMGKKLDKIAELAVDAVLAHMQHKKAEKHACEKLEADLEAAFNS